MTFQALVVSNDEQASVTVEQALAGFGLRVTCQGYEDASKLLTAQQFHAVVADFDDPQAAIGIFDQVSAESPASTIRIAVIRDEDRVRSAFGVGASFVLIKPITREQAQATLRAAMVILNQERRHCFRVPVQAPVAFSVQGRGELEAIMLDLSEEGMDVLAAQPLCPSSLVKVRFFLPGESVEFQTTGEVAWANPNGQSGVRFCELSEDTHAYLKAWLSQHSPETPPEEPEPLTDCSLTDLSSGGCYVATQSPFPERARVILVLRADELQVQGEGVVRVMHPGAGMGIEFASRTEQERAQVADLIDFLSGRPTAVPQLLVQLRAFHDELCSTDDAAENHSDPLVELLRNADSMTREMFLEVLHSQRSTAATAS